MENCKAFLIENQDIRIKYGLVGVSEEVIEKLSQENMYMFYGEMLNSQWGYSGDEVKVLGMTIENKEKYRWKLIELNGYSREDVTLILEKDIRCIEREMIMCERTRLRDGVNPSADLSKPKPPPPPPPPPPKKITLKIGCMCLECVGVNDAFICETRKEEEK